MLMQNPGDYNVIINVGNTGWSYNFPCPVDGESSCKWSRIREESSAISSVLEGLLPVPAEIEGGNSLIMVFVELTVFKNRFCSFFAAGVAKRKPISASNA